VIDLSLNSDKARTFRDASSPADEEVCTMCGEFCAVRKMTNVREGEGE
jgi:phosphomethylpyrimidine synthase